MRYPFVYCYNLPETQFDNKFIAIYKQTFMSQACGIKETKDTDQTPSYC